MAVDLIGPAAASILECVKNRLSTPVALVTVAPGASVAYDNCCDGELWIRVTGTAPVADPVKASGELCVTRTQVNIEIGVIRCALGVISDRGFPTAAEMTADAMQTFKDRIEVLEGLTCCDYPRLTNLRVGTWTPLGPNSGCVGGQWAASFRIDDCVTCQEA